MAVSVRALFIALGAAAGACQSPDANARTSNAAPAQSRVAKQTAAKGPTIECTISRIADGDTVYCGSMGRIRLLMIDAPELSQGAAGRQAQDALADIMPVGSHVTIETDVRARDTYQRILGYIYLEDGRMVNEEMAKSGYVTALVYPPNVKYDVRIRAAVKEARDAKRGLYATEFFSCTPRDYRAGRCGGGRPPDSRRRERHSSS
ncbi:MAG: thermonuclease family protein [Gemmatimonadales bacterium]